MPKRTTNKPRSTTSIKKEQLPSESDIEEDVPALEPDLGSFGDLAIEVPDDVIPEESQKVIIEDTIDIAYNYAFIGSGQAGCRLVYAFHKDLGYRRTILFNTATQDIAGLNAPDDMVFKLESEDVRGAGKNMETGRRAIESVKEDVLSFFRKRIGEKVDHIIICFGAGGGTGGGTANTLISLAKEYLITLGIKDPDKRVGAIMSLPSRSEGSIVNQNAYDVAKPLCELAHLGKLSPLLIIDNERICQLYSSIPIKKFYPVVNKTVVQLFSIFAYVASRSSEYSTFDVEDYRSVLKSGIITCGTSTIPKYKPELDIPKLFRLNLQKNLFASDINFETVTHAAAILAADSDNLGEIPQSVIENTFNGFNLLFGNRRGVMLHRGIYEAKQKGIRMFTIIGGFDVPIKRLEEMSNLGGSK